MGFSFMEAFMDELEVKSTVGMGTIIKMKKRVGKTEKMRGYTQETVQKVFLHLSEQKGSGV